MSERAEHREDDRHNHERRTFLKGLFTSSIAVSALGLLGGIVAFLFPPERRAFNPGPLRTRIGPVEEFSVGGGKQVIWDGRPVWVLRLRGGFVAYSAVCTHKGCIVNWDENRRLLSCPCHNGLFDTGGNVVAGPPLRPLPRLRVEVLGDAVFIAGRGEG